MVVAHKWEKAVRSTRTGRQVKKLLAQNGTDATEETYCVDRCTSITRALSGEDFASEGQLEAERLETMVGDWNV
jgi:hypothetical protein